MMKLLGRLRGKALLIILLIIAIVSAYFTFGESIGAPSWADIRGYLGLSDNIRSDDEIKVTYFFVGNADCALILYKDQKILVDCGKPTQIHSIENYLRYYEVTSIDAIILSHLDIDHVGNVFDIISNFNVSTVYIPKYDDIQYICDNEYYQRLIKLKDKNIITLNEVSVGNEYLYNNLLIKIIAPNEQFSDTNNNSIVCKIIYKNSSFLFTGDIEKKAQKSLLENNSDLRADVIKIPHHGRQSSYYKDFLTAVAPKYAIISAGDEKEYRISTDLLRFLEENSVSAYRTDICGNITVTYSEDRGYRFLTEKEVN